MAESISRSRRKLMKSLVSVPMLPLAATLAGTAEAHRVRAHFHPFGPLPGHGRGRDVSYTFGSMAAPSLENPQMATTYVASTLTRKVGRGPGQTFALGYETFFLTGDMVPRTGGGTIVAGGYYDIHGNPILDRPSPDQRQFFSDCPDGMSLIQIEGGVLPAARLQPHLRGRAVRIHLAQRGRRGHVRQAALPDRDPDAGSGPPHRAS